MPTNRTPDRQRLDRVIAETRKQRDLREQSYREQALKLFPWVCGRCARAFDRANLRELTVHHRDHDHDNNPPDGSNWELLCIYCHEHEHAKYLETRAGDETNSGHGQGETATYKPFANLDQLLGRK